MTTMLRPGQRILHVPGIGITSSRRAVSAGGVSNGLLTGLVAYWSLDETSGNRADATGNGHTATPVNTPGYATGKVSNAVDLERDSAQYLSIADDAALQFGTGSFSISLWIKPETTSAGYAAQLTPISKVDTAFEIMMYINRVYVYLGGASNGLNGSASLSAGNWYHLCLVRNGSACRMYINGALDSSATNSANVSGAGNAIEIGRRPGTGTTEYDGLVDEVGIWNAALTDDQRALLYNAGAGMAYSEFS